MGEGVAESCAGPQPPSWLWLWLLCEKFALPDVTQPPPCNPAPRRR